MTCGAGYPWQWRQTLPATGVAAFASLVAVKAAKMDDLGFRAGVAPKTPSENGVLMGPLLS